MAVPVTTKCHCRNHSECKLKLVRERGGRFFEICNGSSGLRESKRAAYIDLWAQQEADSTINGSTVGLSQRKRGCGCSQRKKTHHPPVNSKQAAQVRRGQHSHTATAGAIEQNHSNHSQLRLAAEGPGSELKKLLGRIGIKPTKHCRCNERAEEMDRQGTEWCSRNIETIVGWLREEAAQRRLPFVATAARLLIRRAISNAGRKAKHTSASFSIASLDPLESVTACITTYRRERLLDRLMQSISMFYPNLKVLVQDTRGNLSEGRNCVYAQCTTPHILMLEDDFVFTEQTRLEPLLTVLNSNPALGGVAGCTNEPKGTGLVGRGGRIWWDRDFIRSRDKCYLASPRRGFESFNGVRYRPCDIVINFGIFRKEVFEHIPWDPKLPVMEHTDWYWRVYLDAQWHFAYVPDVMIDHYRDRTDGIYNRNRKRDLTGYLRQKHGFMFMRDNLPPRINAPNVVILSVGRSNSSIVTKMAAHAFRLTLGDIDPEFYEHRAVRSINQSAWQGKGFDRLRARRVLRSLSQPWIIKDPRFRRTFQHWEGLLQEFDPLLVHLVKNPDIVAESYAAQNMTYSPTDHQRCEEYFRRYTGRKLRVHAEDIGIAASFFDVKRMKLAARVDS